MAGVGFDGGGGGPPSELPELPPQANNASKSPINGRTLAIGDLVLVDSLTAVSPSEF